LETYFAMCGDSGGASQSQVRVNFGQKPFKFPPPAGFQPLALANTPRPTIARPDKFMGIVTYTGNGGTQSINVGFKPDFVWIKERNSAGYNHHITDSVRGVNKRLRITTSFEYTSTDQVTSYNSNGFSLGADSAGPADLECNQSTKQYVAWAWKAGGSGGGYSFWKDDIGYSTAAAAGLTAGTITPTGASVNTKSGFSIINFSSQSSNGNYSVSHGLNNIPKFIIMKSRTRNGGPWWVYHSSTTDAVTKYLQLSTTGATTTNSNGGNDNIWGSSLPSSSTFGFSTGAGQAHTTNETVIAYCWAEIPGFSKFGSYTGNGSSDGPMVVTGFRPRWIMIKPNVSDTYSYWLIDDTARSPYNVAQAKLAANLSDQENSANIGTQPYDILSNGFKVRTGSGIGLNQNGTQYLYACFAESPTQNLFGGQSNAR